MRFDVVTIFPDAFSALRVGLVGKALEEGSFEVEIHDLREWASHPHRKVDDEPFGGGPGMVLAPGPIVRAVETIAPKGTAGTRIIVLSAAGTLFDQQMAAGLAASDRVVLICGRYEGVDQRVAEILGAEEVSIGGFVLTGGEVAAMAVIEATARVRPGFMGNEESAADESFTSGLLEHPHYTRPASFRGHGVPDVLLSGDHGRISRWRREQALRRTLENRPELLSRIDLTDEELALIEEWRAG